jgi:hypothetical protein
LRPPARPPRLSATLLIEESNPGVPDAGEASIEENLTIS